MTERIKICPYCKKEFKTIQWNKIYCCARCLDKYRIIIRRKPTELFKLSDYDRAIYDEYHGVTK